MSEAPGGTDGREYTRLDAFLALCLTRFREFYRESEVVFWSFAFPIMLSVGLGIAFRNRPAETLPVAVVDGPQAARVSAVLAQTPLLKASVMDVESATRALAPGAWPWWSPAYRRGMEYRLRSLALGVRHRAGRAPTTRSSARPAAAIRCPARWSRCASRVGATSTS
jgi:hypothetical protein